MYYELLYYYMYYHRSHKFFFHSAGLQVNKPNFMVNAVKSAESGNPKPAVEDNNKRQIKRVNDKKLDGNGSVTPKKIPARGRFICWFPHRYATFGDNTLFSWMLE